MNPFSLQFGTQQNPAIWDTTKSFMHSCFCWE